MFNAGDLSDLSDDGFGSEEEKPPRPRSGKEARKARSAKIRSAANKDENDVPDSDFYNLQRRVDRMEASIAPLANKIDSVLVSLGADKDSRKLKKKDMENMFDQILSSNEGELFVYRGFRKYRKGHFVSYSRKSVTLGFFNKKFQFGGWENVRYSRKFVISESGTSENLCTF